MTIQQDPDVGFVAGGRLNSVVGWTLLVLGLAASAVLDPWLFSASTPLEFNQSLRPAVRHAQGVVLAMAFLQLAMRRLLATPAFRPAARRTSAWLTAGGTVLYAVGYVLGCLWPVLHVLVLPGSLLNLIAFSYLLLIRPTGIHAQKITAILPVACFGMLLDFTAGVFLLTPDSLLLAWLGPPDGVRLRMMRLARVAAIALAVLTLLYHGVVQRGDGRRRWADWGGRSLMIGAIAMPAVLAAACFTWTDLKYLLPVPAAAVTLGVFVALGHAVRGRIILEICGWLLIASSIAAGMLMGLYAFDGPMPAPEWVGDYNDVARRLTRIAHAYAIVLGMLAIFLSRRRPTFNR